MVLNGIWIIHLQLYRLGYQKDNNTIVVFGIFSLDSRYHSTALRMDAGTYMFLFGVSSSFLIFISRHLITFILFMQLGSSEEPLQSPPRRDGSCSFSLVEHMLRSNAEVVDWSDDEHVLFAGPKMVEISESKKEGLSIVNFFSNINQMMVQNSTGGVDSGGLYHHLDFVSSACKLPVEGVRWAEWRIHSNARMHSQIAVGEFLLGGGREAGLWGPVGRFFF
eukprot:gene5913-4228_t